MKIQIQKCAQFGCSVLGVGPRAQRLWPLEGRLWCRAHFKPALDWAAAGRELMFDGIDWLRKVWKVYPEFKPLDVVKQKPKNWRGLLEEYAGMAGWALEVGDRRTFIHYASRAVWAWALSQQKEE